MALIKCPECGKKISTEAEVCPHCGFPAAKAEHSKITTGTKRDHGWIGIAVIAAVVVGLACAIWMISGKARTQPAGTDADVEMTIAPETTLPPTSPVPTSIPEPTEAPTPEPELTSDPEAVYGPGMYLVGKDIPAGEYFVVSNTGTLDGYFEITEDATGDLDAIITNGTVGLSGYVTVESGQYLKISDASFALAESVPPIDWEGQYYNGMYKVGKDIAPGTYKVSCLSSGYYEVARDSRHLLDSIVANDNFEGSVYVTLYEGQYITLYHATIGAD